MNQRTPLTIAGLVVAFALAVVGTLVVVDMLQDDVWVDPSKGGMAPNRTRTGQSGPEYRSHVANFFLDVKPSTDCADSDDGRCDYVLCWENDEGSGALDWITYDLSENPPNVNDGYPRHRVTLTSKTGAGPYIEIALARVERDNQGQEKETPLPLNCCEHDASNRTCNPSRNPVPCKGAGVPLEMYFPHVTGTAITSKRDGGAPESWSRPQDIPFEFALLWGKECP